MNTDPLVSVAAAARAVGLSRQTLHDQVNRGAVRSHVDPDGRRKVRVSEVVADRRRLVASDMRPLSGPSGSKTAAGKPKAKPAPTFPIRDSSGAVIGHATLDDLIAEYGSLDAAEAAAGPDGNIRLTMVSVSEFDAWMAKATDDALTGTPAARVYLDHLEVDASRADAEALLAAYRRGDHAAIRALHGRLGVRA
jgi:hypothetical protein